MSQLFSPLPADAPLQPCSSVGDLSLTERPPIPSVPSAAQCMPKLAGASHRAPQPSSSPYPGTGLSPSMPAGRRHLAGGATGRFPCTETTRGCGGSPKPRDTRSRRVPSPRVPRGGFGAYHAVVLLQGLALPCRAAEAAGARGGTGDVRPPVLFQLNKRPRKRQNKTQGTWLSFTKLCHSEKCVPWATAAGTDPPAHPQSKAAAVGMDVAGCFCKTPFPKAWDKAAAGCHQQKPLGQADSPVAGRDGHHGPPRAIRVWATSVKYCSLLFLFFLKMAIFRP